jgi:hypothetical protein
MGILLLTAATSAQQPVVVDWITKTLGDHPTTVDRDTNVVIRVENVNDVLYKYSINLTGTQRDNFDFQAISQAITGAKSQGESPGCEQPAKDLGDSSKALSDAVQALKKLPETGTGCSASSPCHYTVDQTNAKWDSDVSPKLKATKDGLERFKVVCRDPQYVEVTRQVQAIVNNADDLYTRLSAKEHVVTKQDVLKPDVDYKLIIAETYNDVAVKNQTATLDLKPANNRLTLSGGVLFTEVQNRSYSTVAAPLPSGSGTQNVLSISGLSKFTPAAIALLNYQIPKLDWDTFGITFSSGPTFRFGSQSNTTIFGYFVGAGVHLYHRVYITPGMNLGQFADFPSGYSHAGQPVPSGSATLTPVTRWTWRFSIGVSYKAKDFSSFGLSGSVKPAAAGAGQTPAQSGTNQKPAKPSNSGNANDSSTTPKT